MQPYCANQIHRHGDETKVGRNQRSCENSSADQPSATVNQLEQTIHVTPLTIFFDFFQGFGAKEKVLKDAALSCGRVQQLRRPLPDTRNRIASSEDRLVEKLCQHRNLNLRRKTPPDNSISVSEGRARRLLSYSVPAVRNEEVVRYGPPARPQEYLQERAVIEPHFPVLGYMRDILVTVIVFGSLPFFFKEPYIGLLMWLWISVMNPHTQGWGFATTFPFAAIIAITILVSLLLTRKSKNLPVTPVTITFLVFVAWINVSAFFALHPELIYPQWIKVMKIMMMIVVTLMILKSRKHVQAFMWMLVLSLGYYGVKGGIFTIASGGQFRVWGPDNTFIGGNNEIALALIFCIPLMHYLQMTSESKWLRHGLTASMFLCALAALGSYSRGALLAIMAMGVFLLIKSNKKLLFGPLLILAVPLLLLFMPAQWTERMDTINTYQADSSAMGRINAWWMAFNLAKARPLVGGGFEIYDSETFGLYAPVPTDVHAAHSIYFQALGEHGFVGLGLYLLLGFLTWRCAAWIIRNTAYRDDLKWAYHLANMAQVSILGFAVGGGFLSLLYFDVPYYLMAVVVAVRVIVEKKLKISSGSPHQPMESKVLVSSFKNIRFATCLSAGNTKREKLISKHSARMSHTLERK